MTAGSEAYRAATRAAIEAIQALAGSPLDASRQIALALRLPGQEDPWCGSLSLEAGPRQRRASDDTGSSCRLYRGKDSFAYAWFDRGYGMPDDDAVPEADHLQFVLVPKRSLPNDWLAVLRAVGCRGKEMPFVMAKRPHLRPALPDQADLELLALALRGVARALDAGLLPAGDVSFPLDGPIPVLEITGSVEAPQVRSCHDVLSRDRRPAIAPEIDAPTRLTGLRRSERVWLVCWPKTAGGDDRDPRWPRVVTVMDSDQPIFARSVASGEIQAAADVVFEALLGLGRAPAGLPEEIHFASRTLHAACARHLEPLGVACIYEPGAVAIAKEPNRAPDEAPGDGDLDGWTRVRMALVDRLQPLLSGAGIESAKARARYFGDAELGQSLARLDPVFDAYAEWLVTGYRRGERDRTLAEVTLAGDLTPGERRLLEAKVAARASIWRIVAAHGDSVTLRCVFTGETAQIAIATARKASEGGLIPGRVVSVAGLALLDFLGPKLDAWSDAELFGHLAAIGIAPDRETIARAPHLLGRLWRLRLETYRPRAEPREGGRGVAAP